MEGKKKTVWKRTTETQYFLLFTVCFADVRHGLIGFTKNYVKEPFACSKDCEALPKSDVVIFVQKFNFSRKEKTWKEILQKKKKKKGKAVWY